jgi:putative NADH-flavin reductase
MNMTKTYAILGATGNCGRALIEILLRTPHARINAFCRDQAKLHRQLPQIIGSEAVRIFEGSIDDIELIKSCVTDCHVIFHVVSTNDNVPGCRLGLSTAESIILALDQLRAESVSCSLETRIVLLSSSTIDARMSRDLPWLLKFVLLRSASNVYEDLRRTEAFLRSHEDRITTIFVKPGGLSVDIQRGHKIVMDHEESFLSYLDLAAAMIEVANDTGGRYNMKNVGVVNTNGSAKFPPGTPLCVVAGLVRHFFPFLHPYLPSTGPL